MTEDIALKVPEIPQSAIDFAKEVGALAEKHDLRELAMDIRINTGFGSPYWGNGHNIQESMTVTVSRTDGRGRPRKKIAIEAKMNVHMFVVKEPDSID